MRAHDYSGILRVTATSVGRPYRRISTIAVGARSNEIAASVDCVNPQATLIYRISRAFELKQVREAGRARDSHRQCPEIDREIVGFRNKN